MPADRAPIVLLDLDGVVADFEAGLAQAVAVACGTPAAIDPADRTTLKATDQYPGELAATVAALRAGSGTIYASGHSRMTQLYR